jgi:Ser/Thr protein kinase RdoA (MazF antagonist)
MAAQTPPDARAAAAEFGLGRVLGEPVVAARGELGRIWRLETATGRWALKELLRPRPEAASQALADVAFQEAALTAGIPMPRPIVARDGSVLVEVGPPADRRSVRVYTWVDLLGRDAVLPLEEVAAILGRLHALAIRDGRRIDSWFRDPVPAAEWPEVRAAARAAGQPWAAALAGLIPALEAGTVAAAFAGDPAGGSGDAVAGSPITCHLDFNPENVLLDATGRVVVVDWENSGPEHAEQELASAVAEFVADPADAARFLGAYEAAGGPARLRDRGSFAMTLIVQARLVRTYAGRALDPSFGSEDRARAASWVEDIAAHAFTLERVDGWLGAAGRAGLLATA